MTILIDGYNLLFAMGMVRKNLPPRGLERAREQLLDWIAEEGKRKTEVVIRIVFDAMGSSAPTSEYLRKGIRVRFAYEKNADETIEEILQGEALPLKYGVVSDDAQVREAARRRKCTIFSCGEFIDWIKTRDAKTFPINEVEKPDEQPSSEEMADWLAVFSAPPNKRKR